MGLQYNQVTVSKQRLVFYILSLLVILLPAIFYTSTSEPFEFNKIILLYTCAALLLTTGRPRLPMALTIFLSSQILSTINSSDQVTSLFGYYGRFNGGLLSTIAYLIIFGATTQYLDVKKINRLISFIAIGSIPVIIYGFLQKLGIDKHLWIQDTTARIFSTLGQPNWLAAYLVTTAPLIWYLSRQNRRWLVLLAANLLTLLFTRSQSGIMALLLVGGVYWLGPKFFHRYFKIGVILALGGLIIFFLTISRQSITPTNLRIPALDRPGTSSWEIRKIVWRGAWNIFLSHPLIGTGTETFAYSYWAQRPMEQNLTSEWNFTYNKAHNEILNYLANNGLVGLTSYLLLTFVFLYYMTSANAPYTRPLLAGWVGLNIAHFFGFSTTTSSLFFFLYPALIIKNSNNKSTNDKFNPLISALFFLPLLLLIVRYWLADYSYAQANRQTQMGQPISALAHINQAIKYAPFFSDYYSKKGDVNSKVALLYYEAGDIKTALGYQQEAITSIKKAKVLSSKNVIIARNQASLETTLSLVNPKLINEAMVSLMNARPLAPTDPKIAYHLGNLYFSQKEFDLAVVELTRAVELKPDYKEARLSLASVYESLGKKDKAKAEYQYILDHIAPRDLFVQSKLK